jgi:hypothetical protein
LDLPVLGGFCHKDTRTQSFGFSLFIGVYLLFKKSQTSSIFLLSSGKRKISSENNSPSPDSSGNPFAFFFKKQKIGTDSGNSSLLNNKFQILQLQIPFEMGFYFFPV